MLVKSAPEVGGLQKGQVASADAPDQDEDPDLDGFIELKKQPIQSNADRPDI